MSTPVAEREICPAFFDIVRGRASVRYFDARPVSHEQIDQLIEAAGWAPSPHGRQPWRYAVLTRHAAKVHLADAMGETWQQQLAMDGDPPDVILARRAGSRRRVVEAPVLIIPCLYTQVLDRYPDPERQAAEELMAVQSLGAAIQNMLLTAYAAGLDAGWMCAPLFCPDIVRAALGLSDELQPHAMIAVGYRAREPKRRPRIPSSDLVVHFD